MSHARKDHRWDMIYALAVVRGVENVRSVEGRHALSEDEYDEIVRDAVKIANSAEEALDLL